VSIAMFLEFRKRKTEFTENGIFRLFYANGKRKWQTSSCLLQTEKKKGVCFLW
jgi:hypothetical protein